MWPPGQQKAVPARATADSASPVFTPPGHTRFGNLDQFRNWLSEKLSAEVEELSPGLVKLTLRLQGDDTDFLSSVLSSYVSQYVNYRRSLEPERKEDTGAVTQNPATVETRESAVPDATYRELQRLDVDQQSYKLALQLIDSYKGVFRGFIPDDQMLGMSLLSRLQQRIILLQLNKEALFVRYYPASPEIRRVDEEIQGLQNDLREFLEEVVRFSQKRREILLAQTRRATDAQIARASKTDTPSPKVLSGPQPPDSGALFVSSDGILVFWQEPSITRKPLSFESEEIHKENSGQTVGSSRNLTNLIVQMVIMVP